MSQVRVVTVSMDELERVIRDVIQTELNQRAGSPAAVPLVLTTEEAAVRARRSVDTIRAWIKSGRLATMPRQRGEHFRIRLEDLESALAARPKPADLDDTAWAQGIIAKRRIGR